MDTTGIILQVERAISEVRRGSPVIITKQGVAIMLAQSGEHFPHHQNTNDSDSCAVKLMKLSGLLPLAVIIPPENCERTDYLSVSAEAIAAYPTALAESLDKVSEAIVPLPNAEKARFISFRPRFGHEEHLAIVIGDPASHPAPLVRLHSSCITGDIFASLRCDCGPQLHKALDIIATQGAGILLYLSQEGRGIGIANKLRAYMRQDSGMDTVEANLSLGFRPDERNFSIAASILRKLGIEQIRLLTNNPLKIEALSHFGIKIMSRVPVIIPPTEHNLRYLNTKICKMNHLLTES